MQTNFFRNLASLNVEGDWQMVIKMAADNRMLISVLFINDDKVGDKMRKSIPPMILKGSAAELDGGFFSSIESPVRKTAGLFANMEEYAKAQEEAKIHLKEKQDKGKKQKPKETTGDNDETDDNDETEDQPTESNVKEGKKYAAQMKKVADLETEGKYGQAITQLPKAEEFPEYKETIEARLLALKTKGGYLL